MYVQPTNASTTNAYILPTEIAAPQTPSAKAMNLASQVPAQTQSVYSPPLKTAVPKAMNVLQRVVAPRVFASTIHAPQSVWMIAALHRRSVMMETIAQLMSAKTKAVLASGSTVAVKATMTAL